MSNNGFLFKYSQVYRYLQLQNTHCKILLSNTCQITDFFLNTVHYSVIYDYSIVTVKNNSRLFGKKTDNFNSEMMAFLIVGHRRLRNSSFLYINCISL